MLMRPARDRQCLLLRSMCGSVAIPQRTDLAAPFAGRRVLFTGLGPGTARRPTLGGPLGRLNFEIIACRYHRAPALGLLFTAWRTKCWFGPEGETRAPSLTPPA
jgi:hypothetical protein